MHPELSLVLLTVLAGAGQGIFILLVALDILFYGTGALSPDFIWTAGILAILFQGAGIIASTSHLGNPQRGWRAVLMIGNSWLSREVITLSLSVGFALLYLLLHYYEVTGAIRVAAGVLGILANIGFYLSSSMVYASVSFVREWANTYTPINFLLFGITSGIGASLAIMHYTHTDPSFIHGILWILIVLTALSFIMKALAFRFNKKAYVSVNIKNAVGINDPDIKLIDMGTSYNHYNTTEYFYPVSERNSTQAKFLILSVAFVLPLIIWLLAALNPVMKFSAILSIVAATLMVTGLVLERRFFFIQGNNIQNLYYSNFRAASAKNPLVSRARKGTPAPTL